MSMSSFLPVREEHVNNFFEPSPWIPEESWISALFFIHQSHQPVPSHFPLLQQFDPCPSAAYTLAPWSGAEQGSSMYSCHFLTEETSKPRVSPLGSSIPTAKRDGCCVISKMARYTAGSLGFVPSKLPTSSGLGDC